MYFCVCSQRNQWNIFSSVFLFYDRTTDAAFGYNVCLFLPTSISKLKIIFYPFCPLSILIALKYCINSNLSYEINPQSSSRHNVDEECTEVCQIQRKVLSFMEDSMLRHGYGLEPRRGWGMGLLGPGRPGRRCVFGGLAVRLLDGRLVFAGTGRFVWRSVGARLLRLRLEGYNVCD